MTVQTRTDISTIPFIRHSGPGAIVQDGVIKQDAGRSAVLAAFTLLAKELSSGKYVPLTDVNPALTSASMLCGANGGNLAAWQAVGDGSLTIVVDGITLDITGMVFTGVTALTDIAGIINVALGLRALCFYDEVGDVFTFVSPKQGLPASTITVLTAGSAGTDVTGTGFLNGLTTVGTVTAATGGDAEDVPAAIYLGPDITAAAIVAGDVEDLQLLTGDAFIDEDQLILENSLTLADVITAKSQTVRDALRQIGIQPIDTEAFSAQENT